MSVLDVSDAGGVAPGAAFGDEVALSYRAEVWGSGPAGVFADPAGATVLEVDDVDGALVAGAGVASVDGVAGAVTLFVPGCTESTVESLERPQAESSVMESAETQAR